jgi:hypothetical protein
MFGSLANVVSSIEIGRVQSTGVSSPDGAFCYREMI